MKTENISKIMGIFIAISVSAMFLFSCAEDFPTNVDSPNQTVLKSIKILNAGSDGNTGIDGVVNENTKTVTFPRIDPDTDVSAIRFEVELSDGAVLEHDSYEFTVEEGKDSETIVIRIINALRFREYFVTIRLNVPVYGADFENPIMFDHSNNGTLYPTFVSSLTRGAGF